MSGPDLLTKVVTNDVIFERITQDRKWGPQRDIPSLDPVLTGREGGCTPERMCAEYEIPTEARAKMACHTAFARKQGSWGHILVEEVSEAISAESEEERYTELIQVAAVAVAWAENIKRKIERRAAPETAHG